MDLPHGPSGKVERARPDWGPGFSQLTFESYKCAYASISPSSLTNFSCNFVLLSVRYGNNNNNYYYNNNNYYYYCHYQNILSK